MKALLRGLIHDQRARATAIRDLAADSPLHEELREHTARVFEEITEGESALVSGFAALERDPIEARRQLVRAEGHLWKAERRLAPLRRYTSEDQALTLITKRMCEEMNWPAPSPLVCCSTDDGYYTWDDGDVVFIAATDHLRMLAWPDIPHEMGHALIERGKLDLGPFSSGRARDYYAELGDGATANGTPWSEVADWASSSWLDWDDEFACDVVGTYTTGPSYAHQHVRLAALSENSIFDPFLPDVSTHPSDRSRARVIAATLRRMGLGKPADAIAADFARLRELESEFEKADEIFEAVFQPDLVDDFVAEVLRQLTQLGVRSFIDAGSSTVVWGLASAWERFRDEPGSFASEQLARIDRLRVVPGTEVVMRA